MPEDQLRAIVEGIRARLHAELETHLASVAETHEHSLAEVRQTAEAEAEQRWAARLESARAEWSARAQSEVAAARSEVERTMVAESMRARVEAEQAAAENASQTRRELEQAVAAERKRAEEEIERLKDDTSSRARREVEQAVAAERTRAQEEIDRINAEMEQVRKRADRELAQAQAALDAERASTAHAIEEARKGAASPAAAGKGTAGILEAIRAIDASTSLSGALAAVARAAATEAPRVALFVVHGSELREWPVDGLAGVDAGPIRADGREAGFLSDVLRTGEAQEIGPNGGTAPAFARLSAGRSAVAVPFTLGGQPVAVLYADDGLNGQPSGAWREMVQILGRHTAAVLAYLTAFKTAQAMHFLGGTQPAAGANEDEAQGARRYARLLVSEIKLYNEGAVRVGRERRDLRRRLKAEIDRARALYEERIASSIGGREAYFEQELVQTLADGDPSLLGQSQDTSP